MSSKRRIRRGGSTAAHTARTEPTEPTEPLNASAEQPLNPEAERQLKLLQAQIKVALAFYRSDLQIIELLRRTLAERIDDGAGLAEMEELLSELPPLSKEQQFDQLPMMPPVHVLTREAAVRLKIENTEDAKRFDDAKAEVEKLGKCIDTRDGSEINPVQKLMEGCNALMWGAKTSFGVWKRIGALEKIGDLDAECLELKIGISETTRFGQISTGRMWFRPEVVLRWDIVFIEPATVAEDVEDAADTDKI